MQLSRVGSPLEQQRPQLISEPKVPIHISPSPSTGSSPLASILSYGKEIMAQEQELNTWKERLRRGYTPAPAEVLTIQSLMFSVSQRVELASRVVASVQNLLNTLKQTPL